MKKSGDRHTDTQTHRHTDTDDTHPSRIIVPDGIKETAQARTPLVKTPSLQPVGPQKAYPGSPYPELLPMTFCLSVMEWNF